MSCWNWPSGFREEDEIVKSLHDKNGQQTNFDQNSSLVPTAPVSLKVFTQTTHKTKTLKRKAHISFVA